jgi:hypothetical protein
MSYTGKIRLLKLYMESLPDALPYAEPEAPINKLLSFSLDAEWVSSVGEAAAANRELETALWGFTGGRRSDDGTFKITSRGPAIESLAAILGYWLEKYPDSFQLQKWLEGATASASAVILTHQSRVSEPLPILCMPLIVNLLASGTAPCYRSSGASLKANWRETKYINRRRGKRQQEEEV